MSIALPIGVGDGDEDQECIQPINEDELRSSAMMDAELGRSRKAI